MGCYDALVLVKDSNLGQFMELRIVQRSKAGSRSLGGNQEVGTLAGRPC